MGRLCLLQLDLLELEVCLVVVAAVVAPSSLILQVLRHLIQKSLWVALQVQPKVVEVPSEFPDFQEFLSNLGPVTQR